ncbi:MAG: DUF4388 domain-containing protein [Planctomycetota bacterium]
MARGRDRKRGRGSGKPGKNPGPSTPANQPERRPAPELVTTSDEGERSPLADKLELGEHLRSDLAALIDVVVHRDLATGDDADGLVENARRLLRRKLSMAGTRHETRLQLEDLVSRHLRRLFRQIGDGEDDVDAAHVLLGALLSGSLLAEFAAAVDRAIVEFRAPRDYSFAGRADFISLEEVLQLLGGGRHRGCLTLERPALRLDIYFDHSAVAFFDPHQFIRRVIPTGDSYREITPDMLREAEERHASDGTPIVQTLCEREFFREDELRDVARQLGIEVLYEFLRDQSDCGYAYTRLDELPPFAIQHNLSMAVTPMLLEGNKRRDDWRSVANVFPDPDAPLRPMPDMFARISSLDLSVLEIKMLAQINGQVSPRALAPAMGLPLHDTYNHLVRFAKAGVLEPPGGAKVLEGVATSVEESVELAIQALDANDDATAVSSALDKVLGSDDDDGELGADVLRPRLRVKDE